MSESSLGLVESFPNKMAQSDRGDVASIPQAAAISDISFRRKAGHSDVKQAITKIRNPVPRIYFKKLR